MLLFFLNSYLAENTIDSFFGLNAFLINYTISLSPCFLAMETLDYGLVFLYFCQLVSHVTRGRK